MAVATNSSSFRAEHEASSGCLEVCVLLRSAAKDGFSKIHAAKDFGIIFHDTFPGRSLDDQTSFAVRRLLDQGLITERRGRLVATPSGQLRLAQTFGSTVVETVKPGSRKWPELRDSLLILNALQIANATNTQIRAIERVEGIAGFIVQRHLGLSLDRSISMASLRTALAVKSLEKAFGNRIKTTIGSASGLPGKAGRALAAELLSKPRTFSADGKLIVALAAEMLGARAETAESLREALLANWATNKPGETKSPLELKPASASVLPANDRAPLASTLRPVISPDMNEFSSAVLEAARTCSEGWPGNRKAFISRVWRAIRDRRPEWDFSQTAFKSMLTEAHRSGKVVLANADLKNKGDLAEIEASAVLYKNAVWHYVRVED